MKPDTFEAKRLAVLSDLHLNQAGTRETFKTIVAELIAELDIDVLILPGDITAGAGQTIVYVRELIRELGIPVYYVPGNHELWNRYNGLETGAIYELFREDPNCLAGKIIDLGRGYKLLGDIHWYDYSYADHDKFTLEQFERKMLRGSRWQDAYYVDWGLADAEVSERFLIEQKELLAKVSGEKVIYVSHMINHPAFAVPGNRFELWGFFNAYLGSRGLYDLIRSVKPEIAICGHVHHRRVFSEDGTRYLCACLGYPKEWRYVAKGERTLAAQVREAIQLIDL